MLLTKIEGTLNSFEKIGKTQMIVTSIKMNKI